MSARRERTIEAWRAAAAALGGVLKIGHYDELILRAELDGLVVLAEEDLPSETLVHTVAPLAGGLHLRVDRERGPAEEAWLFEADLRGVDPRYTLELVRGTATARRSGVEDVPAALVGAVRGVAVLAGGGLRLARAWRGLVDELGGQWRDPRGGLARGEGSFALERDGLEVIVECEAAWTAIRCLGTSPAHVRAMLPEGFVLDGDDEHIRLRWPGHVPERTRIEEALTILLAARTRAPYR